MALDDWLRAEREKYHMPPSELVEDDKALHLRVAIPGLQAKDVNITATPCELVVRGTASRQEEGKNGKVCFQEISRQQVFRRYGLPAEVDVNRIEAKLADGILSIDLPKTAEKIEGNRR